MSSLRQRVRDVLIWNIKAGQIGPHEKYMPIERRFLELARDDKRRELAISLVEEEVAELREALETEDIIETLDAICDVLFTLFGLTAKTGLTDIVEPAFDEVCNSNNSKFEGQREVLENGKLGKGSKYFKPDLAGLLRGYGISDTVGCDNSQSISEVSHGEERSRQTQTESES